MPERDSFYRRGVANIIINVSSGIPMEHGNGLSGKFMIPEKKEEETFAMLVVYPTPEIQDIGDGRKTIHWLKATPLAKDICGLRSEDGGYQKYGVLLCAAEPDLPIELERAIEEEMEFLNRNKPKVEYEKTDDGIMAVVNVQKPGVEEKKVKLSHEVQRLRKKFEKECRGMVAKEEVAKAKQTMLNTAARLVSEGDTLWAGNDLDRKNISELPKWACRLLGLSRPWCYTAQQMEPCPGCGKPNPVGVITCGSCGAVFDKEITEYAKMTNAEKARSLYPDRYLEPVGAAPAPKK